MCRSGLETAMNSQIDTPCKRDNALRQSSHYENRPPAPTI